MTAGPNTAAKAPPRFNSMVRRAMRRLPSAQPTIVVASFGRAGSTLVWNAAGDAMGRARLGRLAAAYPNVCKDLAFNWPPEQTLWSGLVYKTHDYPGLLAHHPKARTIFMFGSALDAALSVHEQKALQKENWTQTHFRYLNRPYRYDALLDEDVLGIRDQCVAWMGHTQSPVLCVRFEALWDNLEKVSAFCKLDIQLPARRPRKGKEVDPDQLARAKATYGPLDAALAKLPDCFEPAPEYAERMKHI